MIRIKILSRSCHTSISALRIGRSFVRFFFPPLWWPAPYWSSSLRLGCTTGVSVYSAHSRGERKSSLRFLNCDDLYHFKERHEQYKLNLNVGHVDRIHLRETELLVSSHFNSAVLNMISYMLSYLFPF